MRKIKFRGKDRRTGEWFYGNLYDKDTRGRTHICTTERGCLDIDLETVGQFTGLKDKNENEIYEGDILGYPEDVDFLPETVIFKDGCFMVKDDYTTIAINAIDTEDRTIIGNIHDNPELLI